MANSVAAGNTAVCSAAVAVRESVSRTDGGGTDIHSANAIKSETQNLRIAYAGISCDVT